MLTYEHFVECLTEKQNEAFKKHPELSMSKGAAIDGMLEQAKREGAREVLEEIENSLDQTIQFYNMITINTFDAIEQAKARASKEALQAICNYLAELKKKYEV